MVMVIGTASAQERALQPPCGKAPVPQFPSTAGSKVNVWREKELRAVSWMPDACLAWSGQTQLAGALAGTFTLAGGMDRVLDRLGAFSNYKLISYQSHTGEQKPLVREAGLLATASLPVGSNLTAKDFVPGRTYGYFQIDSAERRTNYQLTIRERSASRVAVALENTSTIRFAFVPLFEPGALQSVIFLERSSPDRWHYYQAIRASDGAYMLALGNTAAYINRLSAFFNYVANIEGQVLEQANRP